MGWKGASMSIPSGEGCCKSVVPSVSPGLGESVHWSCLPFIGPLANESIPLKHLLGWGGVGSQGG